SNPPKPAPAGFFVSELAATGKDKGRRSAPLGVRALRDQRVVTYQVTTAAAMTKTKMVVMIMLASQISTTVNAVWGTS
ncbi:MAG: hypothetical protein DI535_30860, partial [Citrobacter freundii]